MKLGQKFIGIADNLASVSGHMIKAKGHLGSINLDMVRVFLNVIIT